MKRPRASPFSSKASKMRHPHDKAASLYAFEPKTIELFRHEEEPLREHIIKVDMAHARRIKLMVTASKLRGIVIPIPRLQCVFTP